jgi:hypothetical protein
MFKLKLTTHNFANTVLLEGVQNIPSTSEQEISNLLGRFDNYNYNYISSRRYNQILFFNSSITVQLMLP